MLSSRERRGFAPAMSLVLIAMAIAAALMFASGTAQAGSTEPTDQCPLADTVVEFIPGANLLAGPYSDPVAGVADLLDGVWVSLGHGGSIILQFAGDPVIDGVGADFVIIQQQEGESAEILVSSDGITYVSLGTHRVDFSMAFDIAGTGLSSVSYVKIIDDNIDAKLGLDSDHAGFDLDGVLAKNCGEVPPPPPPPAVPAIDIEKATNGEDADSPTGPQIPVGGAVLWTYVVTNTGDVDLVNVAVTDDQGVAVSCPQTTLAVGGSMLCTANGTAVVGQYANIGCVTAEDAEGTGVSDCDPSHYYGFEETTGGGAGCTPGFWKQSQHLEFWTGFDPSDDYETVFSVDASFTATLLEAVGQGGGGEIALGRHAVAALLNSSNADVDYLYSTAGVIAIVQDAYESGDFNGAKSLLETQNELGCTAKDGGDQAAKSNNGKGKNA